MQVNRQIVDLLKNTIEKNGWVDLPSEGDSMFPLIRQGNRCRFAACSQASFKKGDIALFYTPSEQLVAHRLIRTSDEDGGRVFFFKGDTNLGMDQPVRAEQLIGKLSHIKKQKFTLSVDNWAVRLWGVSVVKIPLIYILLNRYVVKKYMKQSRWITGVFK